jgi:tRNA G10  N-methylase Trm11
MTWHPDMPAEFRNQIVTGDCRELAKRIPDESIDLIFTDPPYPREFLPLYGWLAREAARVLAPGGLCIVMCGHSYLPDIFASMTVHLVYHWAFCMDTAGPTCAVHQRKVSTSWRPILSFSRGAYDGRWITMDRFPSLHRDKSYHVWGQSENSAQFFVQAINARLVWDPFTGGGTVPAVCKMLGRNWTAFEIDPTTADIARKRVEQTQIPWFAEQPQQLALDDAADVEAAHRGGA